MALEIEAKFAVAHLGDLRQRLLDNGAHLIRDRVLERNWRFDDDQAQLSAEGKVLRLRQDAGASLTYKQGQSDPLIRTEIEFEVSHAEEAKAFLDALGFRVIWVYEKYREVFELEGVEIALDQLPFGTFVEIEGSSTEAISSISQALGLAWAARLTMSYSEIFADWQQKEGLTLRDATFEAFEGIPSLQPRDLGLPDALHVQPANSD